jgi:hypothetical protein
MQGIRLFEYKTLLESLSKLRQIEIFNLSEEHTETVIEKEKKLKEIYASYQLSIEQVSETIRQFEHHKHAIRRLIKKNRQYLKDSKKIIKMPASVG